MQSRFTSVSVPCQLFLLCLIWVVLPATLQAQFREPWATSRITGSPLPPAAYRVERVFENVTLENPVVLTSAPGSQRLFAAELTGKIFSFPATDQEPELDLFVDLQHSIPEIKRVYGLTFHPDFAENRRCFVCYILEQNQDDATHVASFQVTREEPPQLIPETREILLRWRSGGHNGGCLKFGPDGYLYISAGDAGPAFPPDPLESGQDVSNVRSTIMRIDVDQPGADAPYSIPPDNPLLNVPAARPEVWAYGFRNPWKMSFDSATGDLWVGDVGWELWEMVYRVVPGGNYGWSLVEGRQPVHRERKRGPTKVLPPTIEHSHIESRSVTGGFVYRGQRLPDLRGAYVYGDYVTGKIWGARRGETEWSAEELVDSTLQIICFGVDAQQELYIVDYGGGIYRLAENSGAKANADFPTLLSQTGLFHSVADHQPAAGVVPYEIIAEPWQDGTSNERFVAIPHRETLGIHETGNAQIGFLKGNWKFPSDSVLVKTVSLEMEVGNPASRRRLETQILHYDQDTWRAYSYHWNEEQTDATLFDGRAREETYTVRDSQTPGGTRDHTWRFASRTDCLLCHTTRGGTLYGFNPPQLDRVVKIEGRDVNQLKELRAKGLFSEVASYQGEVLVDPYDQQADLTARARAYLHVNCAHCHRRGGGGTAAMEVQHHLPAKKMNLLDARPTQGTFGVHDARVVAVGDPLRSILLYRMAKLGKGRMPYFGSNAVDQTGVALMHDWIESLAREDSSVPARAKLETRLELVRDAAVEGEALREAVQGMLATTEGALALTFELNATSLPASRKKQLVALATQHTDPQIRDLFEQFLPPDQRKKRLGTQIDPAEILALNGDAVRGRQLFVAESGLQCRNCHRIPDAGKELGPDLHKLKERRSSRQLLASILEPSKNIDPQYLPLLVETEDGKVYFGLPESETELELVLVDAQRKSIRISKDSIEVRLPQQKSLMPELLVQDMTAQELADLLAFLEQVQGLGDGG